MTKREKILAAIVLLVLLLFGGGRLKSRYDRSLSDKRNQLYEAREQRDSALLELARGREAVEKLETWQDRSLPSNPEVAQSLYGNWLKERCKAAGVMVDEAVPSQRLTGTDAYTAIGYTLNAHGTSKSLATLLYEIYRSPQLQQITRLQIRPATDPSQLSITLQVEALALPGASNVGMPPGQSDRLAKKSVREYTDTLDGRNLFKVYTPPRPVVSTTAAARPEPPAFDDAKHAYVTGIVQVDGRLQAWITVRTTGEVLRLFAGDPVKVGLLEGKIVSIGPRVLVLQSGDEQTRIELGKNLREGKAVSKTEAG